MRRRVKNRFYIGGRENKKGCHEAAFYEKSLKADYSLSLWSLWFC